MKNNKYNLQILHHEETFATRELALAYLNDYYKPFSLEAEPILVKYGDEKTPNVILAFGTTSSAPGGFYSIDMSKANEDIANLIEKTNGEEESLIAITERISEIVKSTGLDFDDNKIKDKITYKPDVKDTIIGNAKTIAEAIDLLSKHVFKTDFVVKETNSVKLTYETKEDSNADLSADVKVSLHGNSDRLGFNDNIIGIKSDGLYSATNLEFDSDKQELIFTTSGYENNEFLDDAVVKRFKITEKTESEISQLTEELKKKIEDVSVEEDGLKYNILVDGKKVGTITIPEDQFFNGASYDPTTKILTLRFSILQDGKIVEQVVNIDVSDLVDVYVAGDGLVLNDNKFSVKKNNESQSYLDISDEGIAVFGIDEALSKLSEEVKNIKFSVQNSDTIKTTLTKTDDSDAHILQSELKIKTLEGTDVANIIKKDANGVYATVKLTYDKNTNKLSFNDGNGEKEYEINCVSVENTKDSPIILTKKDNVLSADVSILKDAQKHNLLETENGSLFADGDSNAHYALWGDEETNVQAVLNKIKPNVDKIPTIEQNINIILTGLKETQERVTANEKNITTNKNSIEKLQEVVNELNTKVENNENDITSINNTIEQLNTTINEVVETVNNYENRIVKLEKAIEEISPLIEFGLYNKNAQTIEP